MTAIIAYHDGERGWIAADRRHLANNSEICSDSASKIVRAGEWLIGLAGASIGIQILEAHAVKLAAAPTPWDLCRAMRQAFADDGYPPVAESPGAPPSVETSFVAVHPAHGSLLIFRAFSLARQDRVCQLGSGGAIAQGAFEALRRHWPAGVPIEQALAEAIRIACYFDSGCGGEPEVAVTGLGSGLTENANRNRPSVFIGSAIGKGDAKP